MGRTRLTLGIACLLFGAVASGPAIAQAVEEGALGRYVAFRERFGLPADVEFVRRTVNNADYASFPYGVPLSVQELKELDRRVEVQLELGEAVAYASRQDGFAGVFIDQATGGVPVFSFTNNDVDRNSEIAARLPATSGSRFRVVEHSLAELGDAEARVLRDAELLQSEGIQLVDVGPMIRANQLEVGVVGLTKSASERLGEYGPMIHVVQSPIGVFDACPGTNCDPAKAGALIRHGTNGGDLCTEGPIVKRANGTKRIITAGHCFGLNGGADDTWKHGPFGGPFQTVALSGGNTWSAHAHSPGNYDSNDRAIADVGIFQATSAGWSPTNPDTYNRVVIEKNNGNPAIGRFVGWTYAPFQLEGMLVCKTGAISYGNANFAKCADIDVANHWRWSCEGPGNTGMCAAISHQWRVLLDTTGGDSGGPYYTPPSSGCRQTGDDCAVTFYGIVTHSVADNDNPKAGVVLTNRLDHHCTLR